MIQIASDAGGPLFVLACLARPMYEQVGNTSIYDAVCFAYDTNEDHIRLRALESLARDQYRQDIIGGNLTEWIIQGPSVLFEACVKKTEATMIS